MPTTNAPNCWLHKKCPTNPDSNLHTAWTQTPKTKELWLRWLSRKERLQVQLEEPAGLSSAMKRRAIEGHISFICNFMRPPSLKALHYSWTALVVSFDTAFAAVVVVAAVVALVLCHLCALRLVQLCGEGHSELNIPSWGTWSCLVSFHRGFEKKMSFW